MTGKLGAGKSLLGERRNFRCADGTFENANIVDQAVKKLALGQNPDVINVEHTTGAGAIYTDRQTCNIAQVAARGS